MHRVIMMISDQVLHLCLIITFCLSFLKMDNDTILSMVDSKRVYLFIEHNFAVDKDSHGMLFKI